MKATAILFPPVPEYLGAPVTFVCARHGAMLLAEWADQAWLFRVHDDHWYGLRKATPDDLRQLRAVSALQTSKAGEA